MKKLNEGFKILSQKDCNKVKGGSWMTGSFSESGYSSRREWRRARRAARRAGEGGCPPPDPTGE